MWLSLGSLNAASQWVSQVSEIEGRELRGFSPFVPVPLYWI